MASRDERELDMSRGVPGETDVPASEEAFSLEEILAEYGAGREQRLMEAVEQEVLREESPRQAPPDPPRTEQPAPAPVRPPAPRTRGERDCPGGERPLPPRRGQSPPPRRSRAGRRPVRRSCPGLPGPSPWRMWWAAPWMR